MRASGSLTSLTFQSAPAIDGGRNHSISTPRVSYTVSIRSRHRWREKRFARGGVLRHNSFNPLPPSMAGETQPAWTSGGSTWFQSAPAIDGGRNCRCRVVELVIIGFNPLPPSMAGETAYEHRCVVFTVFQSAPAIDGGRNPLASLIIEFQSVSIRSRHRWREKPYPLELIYAKQRVSIRSRHRWREKRIVGLRKRTG